MRHFLKFDVRNIIIILFFIIFGYLVGVYHGFLWGREFINHWLVISAFNSGHATGEVEGSTKAIYLLFEEYIKEHPYKIPELWEKEERP